MGLQVSQGEARSKGLWQMSASERKRKAELELAEAEAHDERLRQFYAREEARHTREIALRAALLGGLLALLGSIVATVLTRWIDRRPVVNVAPVVRVERAP